MSKPLNINELLLLDAQKQMARLKKGDQIIVGGEVLSQATQVLNKNHIRYSSIPYSFGAHLLVIN